MTIQCGHCKAILTPERAATHALMHPRRGSAEERIANRRKIGRRKARGTA